MENLSIDDTLHDFYCAVCDEDKTQQKSPAEVEDSPICDECVVEFIVPLFEQAIVNEYDYPPKWGRTVLRPEWFEFALSDAFRLQYFAREGEYRTPHADRPYCRHNLLKSTLPGKATRYDRRDVPRVSLTEMEMALALKDNHEVVPCGAVLKKSSLRPRIMKKKKYPNQKENPFRGSDLCWHCGGPICASCASPLPTVPWDMTKHECVVHETASDVQDKSGLARGRQYQLCPNPECQHPTALRCSTSFCFVCGEAVAEDDLDHWRTKCPRYNQPGKWNAVYDQGPFVNDGGEAEREHGDIDWHEPQDDGIVRDAVPMSPTGLDLIVEQSSDNEDDEEDQDEPEQDATVEALVEVADEDWGGEEEEVDEESETENAGELRDAGGNLITHHAMWLDMPPKTQEEIAAKERFHNRWTSRTMEQASLLLGGMTQLIDNVRLYVDALKTSYEFVDNCCSEYGGVGGPEEWYQTQLDAVMTQYRDVKTRGASLPLRAIEIRCGIFAFVRKNYEENVAHCTYNLRNKESIPLGFGYDIMSGELLNDPATIIRP